MINGQFQLKFLESIKSKDKEVYFYVKNAFLIFSILGLVREKGEEMKSPMKKV